MCVAGGELSINPPLIHRIERPTHNIAATTRRLVSSSATQPDLPVATLAASSPPAPIGQAGSHATQAEGERQQEGRPEKGKVVGLRRLRMGCGSLHTPQARPSDACMHACQPQHPAPAVSHTFTLNQPPEKTGRAYNRGQDLWAQEQEQEQEGAAVCANGHGADQAQRTYRGHCHAQSDCRVTCLCLSFFPSLSLALIVSVACRSSMESTLVSIYIADHRSTQTPPPPSNKQVGLKHQTEAEKAAAARAKKEVSSDSDSHNPSAIGDPYRPFLLSI